MLIAYHPLLHQADIRLIFGVLNNLREVQHPQKVNEFVRIPPVPASDQPHLRSSKGVMPSCPLERKKRVAPAIKRTPKTR